MRNAADRTYIKSFTTPKGAKQRSTDGFLAYRQTNGFAFAKSYLLGCICRFGVP